MQCTGVVNNAFSEIQSLLTNPRCMTSPHRIAPESKVASDDDRPGLACALDRQLARDNHARHAVR